MTRNGIVHLDGWSSKIFASFGGFVRLDFYPLGLLSYGVFVHFGFSLSEHVTAWWECWLSTPVSCDHMTRNGIVHLDGWSSKIFVSFGGFVRIDFYPLGLFSYGAFVHFGFSMSVHMTAWRECWLSTPVSCDHMTRNGIVLLDGFSSKIFVSFGGFVRLDIYPLRLLSYGAFVHFGFSMSAYVTTWRESWLSTPVSCDHMTRNEIVHLDGCSIKIFSSFGGFVRIDFYPLGLLSYGAFVHFGFTLSAHVTAWRECWLSTPLSCDHMTRNGIVHLYGWSSKIFVSFGGFVRLDFYPLGLLSYGAFVRFGFSISAHVTAWREWWFSTAVSCDHMIRNGIVHLDGWSSKIFASFGGFVRLDFYPLGLLSYGAFVHFGFSLSTHVTAWRECWLSTPVSCDHMTRNGFVHLDGWSSKIFSSFGGFVRLDFYPLGLLSYGAFVHFGFSLSAHLSAWRECLLSTPVSCDHMNRNGVVQLDGLSRKIFSSFGIIVRLDFYPLGLLSYGAFVPFRFSL